MRDAEDDAPDGRAAHTCSFVGSQLIVLGGFVEDVDECDDDPISVLDVERMEWLEEYDSCECTAPLLDSGLVSRVLSCYHLQTA